MNKAKRRYVACCLLACMTSLAAVGAADAEISTGHLTLLPELGFQETYRSNVYLTQSGQEIGLHYHRDPRAGFGVPLRQEFVRPRLQSGVSQFCAILQQ